MTTARKGRGFKSAPQPNHDRRAAALKANTPWRKGNVYTANSRRLREKWNRGG